MALPPPLLLAQLWPGPPAGGPHVPGRGRVRVAALLARGFLPEPAARLPVRVRPGPRRRLLPVDQSGFRSLPSHGAGGHRGPNSVCDFCG